jgi:hypothetical protein
MNRIVFHSLAAAVAAMGLPATALAQSATQSVAPQSASPGMPATSPEAGPVPASPTAPNPDAMPATPPSPDSVAGSGGTLPAPPADAMNKTYPACTAQLQDNCTNPGQMRSDGRHH